VSDPGSEPLDGERHGGRPRPRITRRAGRQILNALPVDSETAIERARQIEAAVHPDFRRAIVAFIGAIACLVAGLSLGDGVYDPRVSRKLIIVGLTAGFVALGVLAVRSAANQMARVIRSRGAPAAGGTVRLLVTLTGYLLVLVVALGMLAVPLGKLLVGGAITGVVVGIAAQQSLGNIFAGLLIILSRPFAIGDEIRVRSGAMGGPIDGRVIALSLIYTTLETDEGPVQLPNLGLLSSAVGPRPPAEPPPALGDEPKVE
jgi:small-conductance mechanosensitive channel